MKCPNCENSKGLIALVDSDNPDDFHCPACGIAFTPLPDAMLAYETRDALVRIADVLEGMLVAQTSHRLSGTARTIACGECKAATEFGDDVDVPPYCDQCGACGSLSEEAG